MLLALTIVNSVVTDSTPPPYTVTRTLSSELQTRDSSLYGQIDGVHVKTMNHESEVLTTAFM